MYRETTAKYADSEDDISEEGSPTTEVALNSSFAPTGPQAFQVANTQLSSSSSTTPNYEDLHSKRSYERLPNETRSHYDLRMIHYKHYTEYVYFQAPTHMLFCKSFFLLH